MINKKIKGFSLMEVIVAMFIFVLVVSSSTVAFANMFRSYKDAKDIQENMENAQYAMSVMAKTFRTSSIITESQDHVEVFDYSQDKCFRYEFISNDSLVRSSGDPTTSGDPDTCSVSTASIVTSGKVTGRFYAIASDDTASSEEVGRITISMTIEKGSSIVNLQTTTSLRDYIKSGISL